jgi:hypothetical protein
MEEEIEKGARINGPREFQCLHHARQHKDLSAVGKDTVRVPLGSEYQQGKKRSIFMFSMDNSLSNALISSP